MRILIADSSDVFRIGLSNLLQGIRLNVIVKEASNHDEMLSMLSAFDFDVMVIDYTAKSFGVDSIKEASVSNPECKILSLTPLQHGMSLIRAQKAGALSFVKKDCSAEEIVEAVTETVNGQSFYCNQILEVIKRESINVDNVDGLTANCDAVSISTREKEIIQLIAEGYTNTQIAEKLFISNHTVNTHRKNLMQKLGVSNTASIVMYAVKTGLANPKEFYFQSNS